jgi:hypothetical protein
MKLARSATSLRSVRTGISVHAPAAPAAVAALQAACGSAGAVRSDEGWLLPVPQADQDGELIDTADRVQVATGFLQDVIAAGL